MDDSTTEARQLSRRAMLGRTAVVGGAMVWAVPAIQAVAMTSASAENPSTPSVPETPVTPPVTSPPTSSTPPSSTPPASTPSSPAGASTLPSGGGTTLVASPTATELAYTGFPVVPVVVGGAGAVAAGLVAMGMASRSEATPDDADGTAPA